MSNDLQALLREKRVWLEKATKEDRPHQATSLARMAAEILYYSQMVPCRRYGIHFMHHAETELLVLACEKYLDMYHKTKKELAEKDTN